MSIYLSSYLNYAQFMSKFDLEFPIYYLSIEYLVKSDRSIGDVLLYLLDLSVIASVTYNFR